MAVSMEMDANEHEQRRWKMLYTRLAFAECFVHTIGPDVGTRINAAAMTIPLHGDYPSTWNRSQH